MSEIVKIKHVQNQNYISKVKKEDNSFKAHKEIKNGREKIILGLGSLAAAAVAGIAIYKGKNKKTDKLTRQAARQISSAASNSKTKQAAQQVVQAQDKAVQNMAADTKTQQVAQASVKAATQTTDIAAAVDKANSNAQQVAQAPLQTPQIIDIEANNLDKVTDKVVLPDTKTQQAIQQTVQTSDEALNTTLADVASGKTSNAQTDVSILQENISKATKDYKERLEKGETLINRVEKAKGAFWGKENSHLQKSRDCVRQLNTLSKEQVAAMDDKLIDELVYFRAEKGPMENFYFLKNMTPEEIIKIQQIPRGTGMLADFVTGVFDSEYDEYLEWLTKALK